jgi:hypothetical protein
VIIGDHDHFTIVFFKKNAVDLHGFFLHPHLKPKKQCNFALGSPPKAAFMAPKRRKKIDQETKVCFLAKISKRTKKGSRNYLTSCGILGAKKRKSMLVAECTRVHTTVDGHRLHLNRWGTKCLDHLQPELQLCHRGHVDD